MFMTDLNTLSPTTQAVAFVTTLASVLAISIALHNKSKKAMPTTTKDGEKAAAAAATRDRDGPPDLPPASRSAPCYHSKTTYRSSSLRGAFSSTGLSYMVAPRRFGVRERPVSFRFPRLRFITPMQGTLLYVAAPLLVPARWSSCRWLLDRV